MPERPSHQTGFENFLATLLAIIFGVGLFVFLILVSLGFFLWVLAVAAGVFVLGLIHYFLWGWLVQPRSPDLLELADEEIASHEGNGVRDQRWPRSPGGNGYADTAARER